jgi:hypothetical protein
MLFFSIENIQICIDCAALEGGKNLVNNELIPRATNVENLSQMDPLWYPWL